MGERDVTRFPHPPAIVGWLLMPDWVGQAGGVIAIVVFFSGVVVYLRGSRDKGTIATLESSNDSLLQWQSVATREMAELKTEAVATKKLHDAEVKALEIRVAALEAENERLQSQRPSAEVLVDVSSAIDALRSHMEEHDRDIKALFEKAPAKPTTRKGPP